MPAAFGELYDFYLPRIYGFIARRLGDRAAAEDVTAMTFERALGAVRGDGLPQRFVRWLALSGRRQRGRRPRPASAPDRPARCADASRLTAAPTDGDEAARRRRARRARLRPPPSIATSSGAPSARLPDAHRQVIVLRYLDGLETDELCAVLGCSRGDARGQAPSRAAGAAGAPRPGVDRCGLTTIA